MPSARLPSLHPRQSLRRLRIALAPLSPTAMATSTASSIASTSPLSANGAFPTTDYFPGLSFSSSGFFNGSDLSLPMRRIDDRNVIRHSKSSVEIELEDERRNAADELVALIEPRPSITGQSLGGIEEVMEGRA